MDFNSLLGLHNVFVIMLCTTISIYKQVEWFTFFLQEFSLLNEQNVVLIPEAIFSLCAAFASSPINSSDSLQLFGDCKINSKVCY